MLVFGTFDSLHEGHRSFLQQARALGDEVLVVAARDSYIRARKQREPRVPAPQRQHDLLQLPDVTTVQWGDEWPNPEPFRLLRDLDFAVVALGYDQEPTDDEVRRQLTEFGKPEVVVVRLSQHTAAKKAL